LKDLNNLKIDVSEGVEPSKMGSDILLMSMDESFTLAEATDTNPKTLEAAKTIATERDQGSKLVGESIDGGWALRYEKDRDDGKTTYYLFARRDVDGKAYFCQTSVGFKSLRDGALAACKTLRK
ncbi:MAG: hypothetical protein JKY56_11260, partial [Kofleriaceae bacterium]|nr:hypothetical protein [Kofleriaceae bacterium]